jgi:ribosomal protein S18 acetylase RimI-like enzyme
VRAAAVLRRGSREDLPLLEPLWASVHGQHKQVMPEFAPYLDDEQTWSVRSAFYAKLFDEPGTILIFAEVEQQLVGYGLAHVMRAADTWLADTWQTGPVIGEIETVAVLPGYRGQGIGTQVFRRLEQELHAIGVNDYILGVVPNNTDAIRLYSRLGYRPIWSYLARLSGR